MSKTVQRPFEQGAAGKNVKRVGVTFGFPTIAFPDFLGATLHSPT
jgi:hypothetical protein